MALAFDKSDKFAIDKAAGTPCPHLGPAHQCTIHGELRNKGFGGCVQYDCLGAGQRLCMSVMAGLDWRSDAQTQRRMIQGFAILRDIHELLEMLVTARALPLPVEIVARIDDEITRLAPKPDWTEAQLMALDVPALRHDVFDVLAQLKPYVGQRPPSQSPL